MPNRLRYCGGDDNRTLFDYGMEGASDGGLPPLLRKFSGAVPYLKLIARANGLADPFDARVVEAYWIGNELLEGVEVRQLYDALLERFGKQLSGRTRELVLRQVDGRGFADRAQPGDWVSLHWGWVCEVLGQREQANLERVTRYHLMLTNQTL